ncbi:MAG: SDR family NAD(P)-dependent oxidoreductase [Lewinellaceae bacterium]|nr:SDR family NAD(P)-dependent oxidoreductase [Saprospiraceae bacterium]MCB9331922.1 SDR family NAD(P)-dependent oxidoreductase [Lewinellaceae bacterium]
MQSTKILVTGATGFVGSYLVRLLVQQGYDVRAIRRGESPMDLVRDVADKVEWVEADVTDIVALEAAFSDVTQVFHCAAMVSFHPKDVRRMRQINVEGTANMVNLALHFGVQHFVHVSSIAAFGRSKERPLLDENSKWIQSKGNSQYAISKYLSEQEVWRAHAEGMHVAIVNPSVIFGSGFWEVGTGRVFKQVYQGLKFWSVGHTGIVDVRDVARFMLLAMEQKINGERFILNAENIGFRELFFKVADALGAKRPFVKVTPLLAEIAWRVEWLKEKLLGTEPIVTRESARASISSFQYANNKSLRVPGFSYRPIDQTIQETAEQFLDAAKDGFGARVLPF